MGANSSIVGGAGLGATREVLLTMHAVHNVQHTSKESYYGVATNHTTEGMIRVTSERPAKMVVDIDSIISVRVFLHNSGGSSGTDRPIGQVSIPLKEMLAICGPGIFKAWFLLGPSLAYASQSRSQVAERFRHALMEIHNDIKSPRACLTLLEASQNYSKWALREQSRALYFQPVLVSREQHLQVLRAYFEQCEHEEPVQQQERRSFKSRASTNASDPSSPMSWTSDLMVELYKVQRHQLEEEETRMSNDLHQLTDDANARIAKSNETILGLKADIGQSQADIEKVGLERKDARGRLDTARRKSVELQEQLRSRQLDGFSEELPNLRQAVRRLAEEKQALLMELQSQKSKMQAPSSQPPQPASQPPKKFANRLLPDPGELLDSLALQRPYL